MIVVTDLRHLTTKIIKKSLFKKIHSIFLDNFPMLIHKVNAKIKVTVIKNRWVFIETFLTC